MCASAWHATATGCYCPTCAATTGSGPSCSGRSRPGPTSPTWPPPRSPGPSPSGSVPDARRSPAALLAASGMTVAGLSQTPTVFVVGILVAGASAGLAFAPFADVARSVAPAARGRVLAAINCGTGYGVALAAPIAIVAGASWRGAWLAFAVVAVLAAGWAARVLPAAPREPTERERPAYGWAAVLCPRAAPLLVGGLLIGLGSSAYWTFAVEYLTSAGALSPATSRSFLGIVGVASILATLYSDLVSRLGGRRPRVRRLDPRRCRGPHAARARTFIPRCRARLGDPLRCRLRRRAGSPGDLEHTPVSARPSLGISAVMSANGFGLMLGCKQSCCWARSSSPPGCWLHARRSCPIPN